MKILFSVFMLFLLGSYTTAAPIKIEFQENSISFLIQKIPKDYTVSLHFEGITKTSTLFSNLNCNGFVLSGGFTTKNRKSHDGLLVIDGKEISKKSKRKTGGVIVLSGKGIELYRRVEKEPRTVFGFKKIERWKEVSGDKLQSHPILVFDGKVDFELNERELANRSAIGRLKDGSIIFAIALNDDLNGLSAISLKDFATIVLKKLEGELEWLINLDGGPSALFVDHKKAFSRTIGLVSSYFCAEKQS